MCEVKVHNDLVNSINDVMDDDQRANEPQIRCWKKEMERSHHSWKLTLIFAVRIAVFDSFPSPKKFTFMLH
jgi:hypothetical protein